MKAELEFERKLEVDLLIPRILFLLTGYFGSGY